MSDGTNTDRINAPDHAIDVAHLREKYRLEREARINANGIEQYVEVTGGFAHYNDDIYVEGVTNREPVRETVEALVIGGGFGGLLAASELSKAGIDDFRIIEKAGDFGGTWYWNRYPGAQCDIESYIYMPLLEETGYIPTEKYVHREELFAHAQRIARHYDLYRRTLLQTQIVDLRWSEDACRWIVRTDRGDELAVRWVLSASGPLNRLKLPGIRGVDRFKGHSFHTSRWDSAYTGGHDRGGLDGLAGKRVAVIGTGATAIQVVPYLAHDADHLYVVQRTPSTVDVRANRPTDAGWTDDEAPGWQRRRMDNFNRILAGIPSDVDLVKDGWTDLYRELITQCQVKDGVDIPVEEVARLKELADFDKGESIRKRVDDIVRDPETAEGLKAWYGMMCKRPAFHDEYLDAFNRPNVTLVNTKGRGLDEISETGIVFDGVEHEVDCIIYATGFEVGTSYSRRADMEIFGREGVALAEHFREGTRTLHGFMTDRFPNFFMLGIGQNGFKPNFTDMLGEHAEHVAHLIVAAKQRGADIVEPRSDAVDHWVSVIHEKSEGYREYIASCTPGYYSGEGDIKRGVFVETYGEGSPAFTELLHAWRSDGRCEGLVFSSSE